MRSKIDFLVIFTSFVISFQTVAAQTGWVEQPSWNVHFFKIKFINSNTGFITGGSNKILKTTDSGNSWQEILTIQSISQIWDFYFVNQTTGFATGTYAFNIPNTIYQLKIIKTTDSGNNWFAVFSDSDSLSPKIGTSIVFVNGLTGYASAGGYFFGENYLYKTTDSGNQWSYFSSIWHSMYPSALQFLNEYRGIAALSFNIVKSEDGGKIWDTVSNSHYNYSSIFFINASTGYITGGEGDFLGKGGRSIIMKTTDSGSSWNEVLNLIGQRYHILNSIHFPTENTGYSVGSYSYLSQVDTMSLIFKTTNSGLNWGAQNPNTRKPLMSVFFLDNNTGYAVGLYGAVLKTTDGGGEIVGVNANNILLPEEFRLFQNYPNPFNPVTNLGFGISHLGFVSLKVYDITGKEVATLVNEKLSPGSYEVEFDGSNFSSGIYFYKLITDNFSEVKRMILLK